MLITEIDASDFIDFDHHERIVNCLDDETGLRAYIAIHNRNLGPALGGCRMWPYAGDRHALKDVLRLSRGMTYKSAIADLPLGGGKAVIIGDPANKHPEAFRAMGRFIDTLNGAYITAEDAGTSPVDLRQMAEKTPCVTGIGKKLTLDGTEVDGDPSPSTAYGVFAGIKAAVKHGLGSDDLSGVRVAVHGVGNVGRRLVELLINAGAHVTIADISAAAVDVVRQRHTVDVADNGTLHREDVDVYAPCALGGALNLDTIGEIKAPVIAGAANNQLADEATGMELHRLGKIYAPDYVINSGGIIDIHYERIGYNHELVIQHINRLAETLGRIFTVSEKQGVPTHVIANRMAERRYQRKSSRKVA